MQTKIDENIACLCIYVRGMTGIARLPIGFTPRI